MEQQLLPWSVVNVLTLSKVSRFRYAANCGEGYVSEQITSELLNAAEQMVKSGTLVEIRHYLAA